MSRSVAFDCEFKKQATTSEDLRLHPRDVWDAWKVHAGKIRVNESYRLAHARSTPSLKSQTLISSTKARTKRPLDALPPPSSLSLHCKSEDSLRFEKNEHLVLSTIVPKLNLGEIVADAISAQKSVRESSSSRVSQSAHQRYLSFRPHSARPSHSYNVVDKDKILPTFRRPLTANPRERRRISEGNILGVGL
jgi:hypothetical protein